MQEQTQLIIQYFIMGGSMVAAILAWIAKIRWSKEYQVAKQAEISAKTAQIEALNEKVDFYKDMSSNVVIDMLTEQKEKYEELISQLRDENFEKENIIAKLEKDVNNTNSFINFEIEEPEGDVADTLARVYENKGNYSKAIFAYQKMLLKYPEKEEYIRSRITEIKNILNN